MSTPLPEPRSIPKVTADRLERGLLHVVVFGPGTGEAIVVVLPDGRVGVVDGCASREANPVQDLLSDLEQAYGTLTLAFVCLTHPHADHFKGLAALLKRYALQTTGQVEKLVMPDLLSERHVQQWLEWLKLTEAGPSLPNDARDPVGLKALLDVAAETRKAVDESALAADTVLLDDDGPPRVQVRVCGPSKNDLRDGVELLTRELAELKSPQNASSKVRTDANATSGALTVQYGQARMLLAGDLIRLEGDCSSWNRVLRDTKVKSPMQVVKVAHHASEEAHHADLWAKLAPQVAIVTPFQHAAGKQPPRPEQVAVLAQTARVFMTAPPRWEPGELERFEFLPALPVSAGQRSRRAAGNSRLRASIPPQVSPEGAGGVAVSLDAHGVIQQLLLIGSARELRRK